MKAMTAPAEKQITVKLRNAQKGERVMQVSNSKQVSELKQLYIEELNESKLDISSIRFFCNGKEMANEFYMYSYEVKDEMVITVMIRPKAP